MEQHNLLSYNDCQKILHHVNLKFPNNKDKIVEINNYNRTSLGYSTEYHGNMICKLEQFLKYMKDNNVQYQKALFTFYQGIALGHSEPTVISLINDKIRIFTLHQLPGNELIDEDFLEQYQDKYKQQIEWIDLNSVSSQNGSRYGPQADGMSCFNLGIATLKGLTEKEMEALKTAKNGDVFLTENLIKYSQSETFLDQLIPSEVWQNVMLNSKGEKQNAKEYRDKYKSLVIWNPKRRKVSNIQQLIHTRARDLHEKYLSPDYPEKLKQKLENPKNSEQQNTMQQK